MLTIYLASFLIGGVLVVSSVLFGGEGHGHDVDHGVSHDAADEAGQGDDAVSASAGGHDAVGGDEHGAGHGGPVPTGAAVWLPFLSLRFWTFFAAFFGLAGLALTLLGLAPAPLALPIALGVGALCGTGVAWLNRRLVSTQIDSSVTNQDMQGLTARVLLDVESGSFGRVRVGVKGYIKDLRAITDDGKRLATGEQVLVVSVRDGVAKVTSIQQS